MLLSRTAENLYWLGRHLERAESVARIVSEHTKLLVDLPVDVDSDWTALLAITGTEATHEARYGTCDETMVITHLMADFTNPTSVLRTVANARENLRVSRQMLPSVLWETLNVMHASLTVNASACVNRSDRLEVCSSIIASCQQIVGIISGSISRDAAYRFYELGRAIERADMVTRVLDVRAAGLLAESAKPLVPPADRSPYEDVRWMGVLRTLDAQHSFSRTMSGTINADSVVTFLVDDELFPHSVAHCLSHVISMLSELPNGEGLGKSAADLKHEIAIRPARPMEAASLRLWLDDTQRGICDLHSAVAESFFAATPALTDIGRTRRQVVV